MNESTPKCAKCGKPLKTIMYGFIRDTLPDNYVAGGCLCFGDDRDAKYYCPNQELKNGSVRNVGVGSTPSTFIMCYNVRKSF